MGGEYLASRLSGQSGRLELLRHEGREVYLPGAVAEVWPGVALDLNERGQVVGVGFLGIHARTTEHKLTSLHFETT